MWKTKIWMEGKWLWFTSENEDKDEAEEEVVDKAIEQYSSMFPDLNVDHAMFLVDDLEWVEVQ